MTCHHLLWSVSIWIRSDQRRCIAAMSVLHLFNRHFPALTEFRMFTPSNTQQFHSCCVLPLQKSNLAVNGAGMLNPHFPALTEFKSLNLALWVMNYSLPCNLFPTDKSLLTSRYVTGIFVTDVKGYYILCPTSSDIYIHSAVFHW